MKIKNVLTFLKQKTLNSLSPDLKFSLKIPAPIVSADRKFLEKDIFSYVNTLARKGDNLLFAGVGPYTWHYYSKLKYEVYTIDTDKERAKFGNKNKHSVGSITELTTFYKKGFFKVILANGLIGYGLDSKSGFEEMLQQCSECLTNDGILVIGYNNNPSHITFSLKDAPQYALFEEYTPDIVEMNSPSIEINSENNHTFLFLKKKPYRFDILCGKGRGEYERFMQAPRLAPILRNGFLAIKDTPAKYFNFFRTMYEKKITLKEEDHYLIPKKIHQIWVGGNPLPEMLQKYQETFRKNHPDWEYKLWTDEDVKNLELQNRDLYDNTTNLGEKSDILRLELLYTLGGVYLDTDCESIRPLDELHRKFDFYAALRPIKGGNYTAVMNGMVGSKPGHPLIKKVMDLTRVGRAVDAALDRKNASIFARVTPRLVRLLNSLNGEKPHHPIVQKIIDRIGEARYGSSVLARTGPPFFTKIIYHFPELLTERSIILPPVYLSPFSNPNEPWTFSATDKVLPETFIVHQWDATWTK